MIRKILVGLVVLAIPLWPFVGPVKALPGGLDDDMAIAPTEAPEDLGIAPTEAPEDLATDPPDSGEWGVDPTPLETVSPSPSSPAPEPAPVPTPELVPVPVAPTPTPTLSAPPQPSTPPQAPTPVPDGVFDAMRGETRHETSVRVMSAMLSEKQHTRIFLARDDNNVDALLSLPPAVLKAIPIVQTTPSMLTPVTEQFIEDTLDPDGEIIILGGHVAVEPQVERALVDKGYTVTRIGGLSRVETAKALAEWSGMSVQQAPQFELDDYTVLAAISDQAAIVFHEGPLTTRQVETVVAYAPGDRVAALFYTGMRDQGEAPKR